MRPRSRPMGGDTHHASRGEGAPLLWRGASGEGLGRLGVTVRWSASSSVLSTEAIYPKYVTGSDDAGGPPGICSKRPAIITATRLAWTFATVARSPSNRSSTVSTQ
jgi:hypothetical protein